MPEIDKGEEVGEVQIAEYIVLLLALHSYCGYVEEQSGNPANDDVTRSGVRLLRLIDSQIGDATEAFLTERFPRPETKLVLKRTFRIHISNSEQAGRRALSLITAFNRGGTAAFNAVFDESRARTSIKKSIAAAQMSEPGEALDQYAALPLRNARIKDWVHEAKKIVGESATIHNPVEMAVAAVVDHVSSLKEKAAAEEGTTGSASIQEAQDAKTAILEHVEADAREAAKNALEVSGEPDHPPTKSEVIGIATAAAIAATSTISNPNNMSEALRKLDPEQRAAALKDGRVLVAAGAGAGKSTTLVARVKYLVDERHVQPNRVLVSSFNKKAADELKTKIGKAIGGDKAKEMKVGTLHGVFKSYISEFGTPEEKVMFRGKTSVLSGSAIASAVNRLWRKCFALELPDGEMEDAEAPNARSMVMFKTKWSGNGVTPADAKARAVSKNEKEAALWYEMYEGLKGSIPGWSPGCEGKAEADREYDNFMKKNRLLADKKGRQYYARLGDFDDMILVFRDILKRSPEVQKKCQEEFDHVMIDECQDLNSVQNEVLELMTRHITDGSDGKSFWMVGDDKQSIYAFRGARPDIFTKRNGQEGWTTQMIRTNYRCAPEIIDAANQLIAHNEDQIPMEANAAPGRSRGEAHMTAMTYPDEASTAIAVAQGIKQSWDEEGEISNNAVLCRTNKELNSYETALLMRGIPYARKGASSFLSSPETKSFLGYITLVTDSDTEKMQASFRDILNKPNRFFVKPEQVDRAIDSALNNYARKMRIPKKAVDPLVAMRDSDFQGDLIFVLKGEKDPRSFKAKKGYEQLDSLMGALDNLSALVGTEGATTKDMFDAVLDMPGTKFKVDPTTGRILGETSVSFREELTNSIKDFGEEEEEEQDEANPEQMSLGNISFLYELAKPNPDDPGDVEISPETPKGFWAKMGRLQEKAKELRIDLDAWDKQQENLSPEDRKPAPGVYLGTVHSVKGAQWPNVYVQMPKGKFPMEPRKKKGEEDQPPSPEEVAEAAEKLTSERRLAYVALTRPSKNLHVVAPAKLNGAGAGFSRFVSEAGLNSGENVKRPGEAVPEEEAPPKTAGFFEDQAFVEDYALVLAGDF